MKGNKTSGRSVLVGAMTNVYRMLPGMPETETSVCRSRDDIEEIHTEMGFQNVDWIQVARDSVWFSH